MGVSNVVGDIHFDRFLLYHKFSMREKSSPKYLRGGGAKKERKGRRGGQCRYDCNPFSTQHAHVDDERMRISCNILGDGSRN